MADPTFAEQMVAKYEALLLKAVGLQSVNVDGQSTSLKDLEATWQFWKSQVAKEAGTKPRLSAVKMGGV